MTHYPSATKLQREGIELVRFEGRENQELLQHIGELRLKVWQASGTEIRLPTGTRVWLDIPGDWNCTHWALVHGGTVLASTRLGVYKSFTDMPGHDWFSAVGRVPCPFAQIGRLVVAPKYQRVGVGKYLDEVCIAEAVDRGCKAVFCDVPPYRIATLERRGFRVAQPAKFGVILPRIQWTAMLLEL